MAERRMFAKTIIDSDAFLDMPTSTQSFYFHLGMRADDDGFINNPKKILKFVGGNDDDFKLLIAKKFIIPFESGVVVIKHWKIHNYIQSDRYKPTLYREEREKLVTKDNKGYALIESVDNPTMYPKCIQDGDTGKVRLGKVSLGKVSKGRKIPKSKPTPKPTLEACTNVQQMYDKCTPEIDIEKKGEPLKKTYGEFNNVKLTDKDYEKLKEKFPDYEDKIEALSIGIDSKGYKYKNHYSTILNWDRRDKKEKPVQNERKTRVVQESDDEWLI